MKNKTTNNNNNNNNNNALKHRLYVFKGNDVKRRINEAVIKYFDYYRFYATYASLYANMIITMFF